MEIITDLFFIHSLVEYLNLIFSYLSLVLWLQQLVLFHMYISCLSASRCTEQCLLSLDCYEAHELLQCNQTSTDVCTVFFFSLSLSSLLHSFVWHWQAIVSVIMAIKRQTIDLFNKVIPKLMSALSVVRDQRTFIAARNIQ